MDLGHNLFRFLARQQVVEKLPTALLALSETSPGLIRRTYVDVSLDN